MSGVLSNKLARRLIDEAPEGVLVADAQLPGIPVVFVNRRFELWTGGGVGNLLGQGLLSLPCIDAEQAGLEALRAALSQGQSLRSVLRMQDREGATLWMDTLLEPLRDESSAVTHFVTYCRKLAAEAHAGPPVLQPPRPRSHAVVSVGAPVATAVTLNFSHLGTREEPISGADGRQRFEDILRLQWSAGQREGRALTLIMFEVDCLPAYIDTFGRTAAESCLKKIGRLLSQSFRRGTDVVVRIGDAGFAALVQSADLVATTAHARTVAERVFEMQLHNPRSVRHRFLTVSVGIAHTVPALDQSPDMLLAAAGLAARRASGEALNQPVLADSSDFAVPSAGPEETVEAAVAAAEAESGAIIEVDMDLGRP